MFRGEPVFSQDDYFDVLLPHQFRNVVPGAHDLNTVNPHALLKDIIIHKSKHLELIRIFGLIQDPCRMAGIVTGANNQHALDWPQEP